MQIKVELQITTFFGELCKGNGKTGMGYEVWGIGHEV